nr:nuclear receptor-binding factor 2-like [Lytechinus pictus]
MHPIPKSKIILPMDPDSPLNRAHQCERKAERMMNNGLHDAALLCYQNASEYIVKAMEKTKDAVVLHSLRLQKENYDKMPNLVNKRRQLDEKKMNLENLQLAVPKPDKNGVAEKPSEEDEEKADDVDGGQESDDEGCLKSMEPVSGRIPGVLQAKEEKGRGRTDSFESLPSVASEDTDSLLQCLNEYRYSELDKKDMRTFYRPTKVLQALREFGSGTAKPSLKVHSPHQQKQALRKMEVDDKVLLEELSIKTMEMKNHVVNLLEQMERCQQENDHLKNKVKELQQELETQKSQRRVQQSVHPPTDFRNEFSVPFSLLAPPENGVSDLNSTPGIIIPQTPPALAPLEMPNFDDQ